ncbi:DoxX family protein [Dyadobacter tibetensis]|uniref:DoxX family protein n=1 Tax=Dyadobacter tibetensis TaxID=1211851 RepID=UPI0004720516|nr:membrane protein [Dyadobacter tibetensis]
MKPLILLLFVFAISALVFKLFSKQYQWSRCGRIAMFAMLCFTTLGHFMYAKGMSLMIPEVIPFKIELVYLTGFLEVGLGLALLRPGIRQKAAWMLIVLFILLLPANISAALSHLDYQSGTFDGPGPAYLWFRVPLQLFFIGWVYLFAIRS